ncbi:MAG: hypothetical protein R3E58_07030 [Phycisphaerae bacterium]
MFVRVFDITIADYETDPITASIDLGNAGGPAPAGGSQVVAWSRTFQGSADFDNTENPLAVIGTPDGGSLFAGGTSSFSGGTRDTRLIKLVQARTNRLAAGVRRHQPGDCDRSHPAGGYRFLCSDVGSGVIFEIILVHVDDNGDVIWAMVRLRRSQLAGTPLSKSTATSSLAVCARFWSIRRHVPCCIRSGRAGLVVKPIDGDKSSQAIAGIAVDPDGNEIATGRRIRTVFPTPGFNIAKFDTSGDQSGSTCSTGTRVKSMDAALSPIVKAITRLSVARATTRLVARRCGERTASELDDLRFGHLLRSVFWTWDSDDGFDRSPEAGLGNDSDLWVIRPDTRWKCWTTTYGGPGREKAGGTIQYAAVSTPIAVTEDEGYIFLASSDSFGESFSDVWIQKVSETGTIDYDFDSPIKSTSEAGSFENYDLDQMVTNATPSDVAVTVTPLEVETLTPDPIILTHAEP